MMGWHYDKIHGSNNTMERESENWIKCDNVENVYMHKEKQLIKTETEEGLQAVYRLVEDEEVEAEK